jgi:hypothetical protein
MVAAVDYSDSFLTVGSVCCEFHLHAPSDLAPAKSNLGR